MCLAQSSSQHPTNFEVHHQSPDTLMLINGDGSANPLAIHQSESIRTNRIEMPYISISSDNRYLAYVITEYQGSFVLPSKGFYFRP